MIDNFTKLFKVVNTIHLQIEFILFKNSTNFHQRLLLLLA